MNNLKFMKYLLIICFSCLLSCSSAQEITYKPIFINQFTNEIEKDVSFCLTKDSLLYNSFNNRIYLSNVGTYALNFDCYNTGYSFDILISKNNLTDTFYLPKLSFSMLISNPPFIYWSFTDVEGLYANGKVIDYYKNGQIRLEGKFKKGQATGNLIFYYDDGKIKRHRTKHKCIDYYKNGQLKSIQNFKKKVVKNYYPNGELKRVFKYGKRYGIEITFFENGQVNTEQKRNSYKSYDSQGRLIYKSSRKESFIFSRIYDQILGGFDSRGHIYSLIEFDENGNKIAVYRYSEYENSKYNFFTIDDLKFVNSFLNVAFYESDNVILELKFVLDFSNKIDDYTNIPYAIYKKENGEWKFVKTVFDVEVYNEIQRLRQEAQRK